ncbi:MAG: hypothetical protein V7645_3069 [Actinomycetota bacterium]|jgi:hypothetical protein
MAAATLGITIGKQDATVKFGQALVLALGDGPLPEEWLDRTRRVGLATSKTFTPVLGTALLAKAADRHIDAFSLRESESHKSYSARTVAKEILVPCCVNAGIDLRSSGAEPLNNQPFLRAKRISTKLDVKSKAVPELEYLCECLAQVDFLEGKSALEALAAFLRVRIEATASSRVVSLGAGSLPVPDLVVALDAFVRGDAEGGKVGQAITAAVADLVFADVRTKKINDPSSKWPGDVGAFDGAAQTAAAEVKQRPATEAEILLFAQKLGGAGVRRGFIIALAQGNEPLDEEQLAFQARRLYGVELFFFVRAGTLLRTALAASSRNLTETIRAFPDAMLARMRELEVSSSRQEEWASRFRTST